MIELDISAQAMIKESREVSATLDKDQPYYFTVKAKKEKNGVRLRVKFCYCDLRLTLSRYQACYLLYTLREQSSL